MFGHNGWSATLEDWFDPRRVRDDYVPTGFKPFDRANFPVKGTASVSIWTTLNAGR